MIKKEEYEKKKTRGGERGEGEEERVERREERGERRDYETEDDMEKFEVKKDLLNLMNTYIRYLTHKKL